MKKLFIFLFFSYLTIANVYGASFKDASKALSNCADLKFEESHNRWSHAKIPQWESIESTVDPKINDKYIKDYLREWPINWIENRDEILKKRETLYNNYYDYVLSKTSDFYIQKISDFEKRANEKLVKAKENSDYFDTIYKAYPSYASDKGKLFKEASKDIKSAELIKINKQIDEHMEWELKNLTARLTAIDKSKALFFSNMSTKEKLELKKYNKLHLKCENEYNNGQITFIQKWK
tara:strand:- start:131 stop:838 length:708 start_codon:yes stop_codon:yes gene_type:complete